MYNKNYKRTLLFQFNKSTLQKFSLDDEIFQISHEDVAFQNKPFFVVLLCVSNQGLLKIILTHSINNINIMVICIITAAIFILTFKIYL